MSLAIECRTDRLSMSAACEVLGLNRSSVYLRQTGLVGDQADRRRKDSCQPRALSESERQDVLAILHSEDYRDQPSAEVYARLLENGEALCSVSSMHRLLRKNGENGDRRLQRPAQHHAIPRLKATAPNQVWTWDITKLSLQQRGVYLSLYVLLDLFSRYNVAWMVSSKENSALAIQLMEEACARYSIDQRQLTLHQDRGSPMTATGFLTSMNTLDITCSHSRPRVSNDNPFSESGFKTMKYQPDFPGRFRGIEHARQWCSDYFQWANYEHHHSGLNGYTPSQVYTGEYRAVAEGKQAALNNRYQLTPERFVRGRPIVKLPPAEVFINPVTESDLEAGATDRVNFSTLTAAGYQRNAI